MKTPNILMSICIIILIAYIFVLRAEKTATLPANTVLAETLSTETEPTEILPIYGKTNQLESGSVVSIGRVIQLKKEDELEYRKLHADVWPEVIAAIANANIRNYQLYVGTIENKRYLFSHFEYHGADINKDLATIRANPIMNNKWLPITDSYQIKMPGTGEGQQWLKLESIMQLE